MDGVTLPGAALRLPRAKVHPALWAGERSETSRPALPCITPSSGTHDLRTPLPLAYNLHQSYPHLHSRAKRGQRANRGLLARTPWSAYKPVDVLDNLVQGAVYCPAMRRVNREVARRGVGFLFL
jgi:hypothetical protein